MKVKFCEYGPRPLGWIGYPKFFYKFLALGAVLPESSGLFQLLGFLMVVRLFKDVLQQGDQIWLFWKFVVIFWKDEVAKYCDILG